LEKNFPR